MESNESIICFLSQVSKGGGMPWTPFLRLEVKAFTYMTEMERKQYSKSILERWNDGENPLR